MRKFNPFKISEIFFGGLEQFSGYRVILPITRKDAEQNTELYLYLLNKTVKYLKSQNVNIIYYDNMTIKSDDISFLEDTCIEIFYIKDILNRAIKVNDLSKKDVNVSVIVGDYNKTEIVLNEIYDDLNFLNLVEKDSKFSQYEKLTDQIFCDSGLEVSFSNNVLDADIIINLCESPYRYLNRLNENVCVIDLTHIANKKSVHKNVVKNISIKVEDFYLKDYELELIMYANSYTFRLFRDNSIDYSKYLYIKGELNSLNARFSSYKI